MSGYTYLQVQRLTLSLRLCYLICVVLCALIATCMILLMGSFLKNQRNKNDNYTLIYKPSSHRCIPFFFQTKKKDISRVISYNILIRFVLEVNGEFQRTFIFTWPLKILYFCVIYVYLILKLHLFFKSNFECFIN